MAQQHAEQFETLVLSQLDAAYTLARYLLRDEHDAQDAVQDAALRAFRNFHQFRGDDPRAWFMTIVRNCCFSWRRRYRRDRIAVSFEDYLTSAVDESPLPDALAIAHSERVALERAVGGLPLEFREVVVLREIEGMSYAQIATVTGAPIGTVMSRLSRARRRLAMALGTNAREVG